MADDQYTELIKEVRVEKRNLKGERKKLNKNIADLEKYILDLNNIIASKLMSAKIEILEILKKGENRK